MRALMAVGVVCGLMASGPASALKLDLRKLSCQEFLKEDKDFHGQMLMWLTAYSMSEGDEPVVDFDEIVKVGQKLGAYCARNPDAKLLTAYESASQ